MSFSSTTTNFLALPDTFASTPVRFLTFANNQLTGPIPPSYVIPGTSKASPREPKVKDGKRQKSCSTQDRRVYHEEGLAYRCPPMRTRLGSISTGASKNLVEVLFLGNHFQGCLPYQIGFLHKATIFDVSKNQLTGPIPCSFGCLENIRYLNLEHNRFYGEVPETVCKLLGLRNKGN